MKLPRPLWILLLRLAAFGLDLIGRPHNIRRRLGQMNRVKRGAASLTSNAEPSSLSVVASEPK